MKLYCATTNPGKLREFRLIAGGIDLEPLAGLGQIPACPETGASFEENAVQKALYYGAYAPGLLLAEDSGLEVDALGGAPGVLSARFAGPDASDADNNRLLLERLEGVENRRGRYVCVAALADRGRLVEIFRGVAEGEILSAPRGGGGFGYDPLFFYPPLGRGFAELTPEEKFRVSHRGAALRALIEFLARSDSR